MPTNRSAKLNVRLPGYAVPDTGTPNEGILERGNYLVLEEKPLFPNSDTDFVRVESPSLSGGETWICTRWKTQQYATIQNIMVKSAPTLDFAGEALAVHASDILALLPSFKDFTYDLHDARYPWALPNVKVPQAPPKANNCCTFVEALLVKAFSDAHGAAFSWDSRRHRQFMISSTDDYFSPVTAAVETGMGVLAADIDAAPAPWTLIQGWRKQWDGGHTFLVLAHHVATDKVLTLESNSSASMKLNGVGFRGLGNLSAFNCEVPADWWTRPDVWTWEEISSTYQFRHAAYLKVV